MKKLNLPESVNKMLEDFVKGLASVYGGELIAVMLYGSAASGEYAASSSNVNVAIILEGAGLENVAKASGLIRKSKFRIINPTFLTEKTIRNSTDVFPLEFLDMKENRVVLYGRDVMRDVEIDVKNLRFQCEQELKSKLINIKKAYLETKGTPALRRSLFGFFTSTLHLLRNMLRLKGLSPVYLKEDILTGFANEFNVDVKNMRSVLDAKIGLVKLKNREVEKLFFAFASDLEKITEIVDTI